MTTTTHPPAPFVIPSAELPRLASSYRSSRRQPKQRAMSFAVSVQPRGVSPGFSLRHRHSHRRHATSGRAKTSTWTARYSSGPPRRGKPPVPASQPPPLYVKRSLRGGQVIKHPGTVIVRSPLRTSFTHLPRRPSQYLPPRCWGVF